MEAAFIVIPFFFLAGLMGAVGMLIGDLGGKGNRRVGFVLGALFGPIGWIIVAVVPPREGSLACQQNWKSVELQQRMIALLEAQLAEIKKNTSDKSQVSEKVVANKPIAVNVSEDSNVYRLD